MRTATRWFGLVAMISVLVGVPALANPARGGASATPKVHGSKTIAGSSAGPKTTSSSKGATTKPTKSTTPKGNSAAAKTKGGATTGTTRKASTTTTSNTTSGSTTTSSGTTTSTTDATAWKPTNAISEKVSTKPNIMRKVSNSLPAGTDLNNATLGFKNFGQFVAAVNVSNNHGIAFADLKAAMTGIDMMGQPVVTTTSTGTTATTPVSTMTLGQAIQKLKPGVDAATVAQNALTQADKEINSSTTTTRSPSSTSASSTSTSASTSTTATKAKPKSR